MRRILEITALGHARGRLSGVGLKNICIEALISTVRGLMMHSALVVHQNVIGREELQDRSSMDDAQTDSRGAGSLNSFATRVPVSLISNE
jgi:hypothetical protein